MPVELDTTSFGRAIVSKRKQLGLSQKDLAGKIMKEDGAPITPQYLNDIEHDRRSPSSDHIVKQFANVLSIKMDLLYWLAGRVPRDIQQKNIPPDRIDKAFEVFRRAIKGR
jgi:transcriptional regulator with XRE-family HTH domain